MKPHLLQLHVICHLSQLRQLHQLCQLCQDHPDHVSSHSYYSLYDLHSHFYLHVLCVLAYCVGVMTVLVAVGVIVALIVGTCIFICILLLVWNRIKRSSMYTHTCTLNNFTRCVTFVTGGICSLLPVSLPVILHDRMLTTCTIIMLDWLPWQCWTESF